jgi:hypothetical protein
MLSPGVQVPPVFQTIMTALRRCTTVVNLFNKELTDPTLHSFAVGLFLKGWGGEGSSMCGLPCLRVCGRVGCVLFHLFRPREVLPFSFCVVVVLLWLSATHCLLSDLTSLQLSLSLSLSLISCAATLRCVEQHGSAGV